MKKHKVRVDLVLIGPALVDGVLYSAIDAKESVEEFLNENISKQSDVIGASSANWTVTVEEIEE